MRPVTITVTGVATSVIVPMDRYPTPFNVGLGLKVGAGATVSVQYTFDDVYAAGYNPTAGTSKWYDHATLVGKTGDDSGNIAFSVQAIRLNQTVGASTSTLNINQAG